MQKFRTPLFYQKSQNIKPAEISTFIWYFCFLCLIFCLHLRFHLYVIRKKDLISKIMICSDFQRTIFFHRGGARQRGPNFGQRPQMAPGRFPGPRNTNLMRPRGPHNIGVPRGQPQGQFQQGFNQRPGMSNGRPRFPHEIMPHGGQLSGSAPQIRQPLLSCM